MSPRRPTRPAATLALVASILACLVGLVVWLPARLATRWFPAPWSCPLPGGTLWHGHCDDLRHGAASAGAIGWRLRFLPLLRARLGAEIGWSQRESRLSGDIEVGRGRIAFRDLRGDVDLAALRALPVWPPGLLAAWPPGAGRLRPDITELRFRDGRLERIRGAVEADGLEIAGRERSSLGDYRVEWRATEDPSGLPAGVISDRGGPLEVRAQLRAEPLPGGDVWRLTGTARARDPAWRPRLLALGPADEAGRHVVSLEWR